MKKTLRLFGLLLALVPWSVPKAVAQCTVATPLDFSATANGGSWLNVTNKAVPNSNVTVTTNVNQGSAGTASTLTTGTLNTKTSLNWNLTYSATDGASHTSTAVFEFSRQVANLEVIVQDIDATGATQIDEVTFEGLDASNNVLTLPRVVGSGASVRVTGNVALGIAPNSADAATATATFSVAVKKLRITFKNNVTGTTDPGGQVIGIERMSWCKSPTAFADAATTPLSQATTINVLSNDIAGDAAISPTTVALVGPQTGGTFTTNASTGNINFTPANNFAGAASVNYTVRDANGVVSNQATLTVVVTKAPTAVADAATTPYKSAAFPIAILNNDVAAAPDASNAINASTVILSSTTGSNGGTFSVNTMGVVTFTPPTTTTGASLTTSITYTVKNSATPAQTSTPATITVTVTNAAPTVADRVNGTVLNTAAAAALSPSLSGSDAENDLAYYTITGGLPTAAQGVLLFNGTAVTTNTQITANQLTQLTFNPTAGYVGRVVLTYKATDRGGVSSSSTATYAIPVGAPNTISGVVFEDVNYGGGTGVGQAASNGVGRNGVTVELYTGAGAFSATATTATVNGIDGTYSFSVATAGSYVVRVVNKTVSSSRTGAVSSLLPVQTYVNGDGNRVGGEAPEKADADAQTGTQTLTTLTPAGSVAQSRSTVTLASGGVIVADFGFGFDVVVNVNDAGQGSLRQFVANANALSNTGLNQRPFNNNGVAAGTNFPAAQETSIFMISDGTAKPGLRAGLLNLLTDANGATATTNSRALITLTQASGGLIITADGTAIDGTTQTTLSDS
ncbi:MAG TPA: Ig-like domain-containing protein, partial [Hymenobacter sp.]